MICRFILLSTGLFLASASACSGSSPTSPGEFQGPDAEAEGAVASDDGTDSGGPSGDASSLESGSDPGAPDAAEVRDAGPPPVRDAGLVHVACNQAALGVCQAASVTAQAAVKYRTQCTSQGGTAEDCPTSGLVGCCVGDTSHYCYYSIDYTPATAQSDCSIMNGTWSTTM